MREYYSLSPYWRMCYMNWETLKYSVIGMSNWTLNRIISSRFKPVLADTCTSFGINGILKKKAHSCARWTAWCSVYGWWCHNTWTQPEGTGRIPDLYGSSNIYWRLAGRSTECIAIRQMKEPSNLAELRQFIGVVTYLSKFMLNLTTVMQCQQRSVSISWDMWYLCYIPSQTTRNPNHYGHTRSSMEDVGLRPLLIWGQRLLNHHRLSKQFLRGGSPQRHILETMINKLEAHFWQEWYLCPADYWQWATAKEMGQQK